LRAGLAWQTAGLMVRIVVWFALALAFALCGCAGSQQQGPAALPIDEAAAAVPLPASYKTDILAILRIYLRDPTNIRSASVADPLPLAGRRNRQIVCLQFDAKNSDGEYSGLKERVAIFSRGKLDQMIEAPPEQCAAARYQPFPEAERLSR
jgi:hypothetical protein